ncbi:hypothetical protein T01_1337 [Trichinella spiralis]|uniref:Uncharacterized protein n=1 Tax=Trichinella spiralis TaxID=6334 RepID=A0A0V1AIK8_TRISP|nr:hypothetical protein T01_1337 [Trichinella spiralis]
MREKRDRVVPNRRYIKCDTNSTNNNNSKQHISERH